MITPQEISEKTFVKAVFGGYDMETVDQFLEPLTEDYIKLYKENAVLKNKMKVLVETIEEYRRTEETVKKTLLAAQRAADEMVAEAEKKSSQILNNAEAVAQSKVDELEFEILSEEEKLTKAKTATLSYFEQIKEICQTHESYIDQLQTMEVRRVRKEVKPSPYDFDVAEKSAQKSEMNASVDEVVAQSIEKTIEQIKNEDRAAAMEDEDDTKIMKIFENEGKTADNEDIKLPLKSKFEFFDLQFGKDYDPVKK